MNKYFRSFALLCIILILGFGVFSQGVVGSGPIDGGAGDDRTIAKVGCVSKMIQKYEKGFIVSYVIGAPGYRYHIEGKPATLYAQDPAYSGDNPSILSGQGPNSSPKELIHPTLKLNEGFSEGKNALLFQYSAKLGQGLPKIEDYFLDLNAKIVIRDAGSIKSLSADGKYFFKADFSNLNTPGMPTCSIPGSHGFIGVSGGNGCTTNCEPPGFGGCYNFFGDYVCKESNTGSSTSSDPNGSSDPAPAPTNTGTCTDQIQNGNETGVDQGGSCEGGILGQVGPGSNQPPIEHIYGVGKPVLINWQDINLPGTWDPYLTQAKKDWNLVRQIRISIGGPGYNVPMNYRDDYTEQNGSPAQWIGAASYFVAGGGHQQGTVVDFNKKKMDELNLNTPAYIAFLLCHELGHALGAGHQDVNNYNLNLGSCMDYSRHPEGGGGQWGTLSNEHPNQKDIDAISGIYGHTH